MAESVHRSQARPQVLRQDRRSGGDAEPHRGSEELLRPVPAWSTEPTGGRTNEGLQAVFKSVFPITDFTGQAMLEFVRYEFEPPKYDVDECQQRGMTYRRAAQGDAAPDRVRSRPGDRRQVGQGHQGAGRLHGRHAAHDRRTAPSSSTAPSASSSRRCTVRRACSSTTTRARPIPRASSVRRAHHSRIAAPGSISSSTPRTSSMSASTAAASCRSPRCSMRSASTSEQILDTFYKHRSPTREPRTAGARLRPQRFAAIKPTVDLIDAKTGRSWSRPARRSRRAWRGSSPKRASRTCWCADEDLYRPLPRRGHRQREDRRDLRRGRRRDRPRSCSRR